MTRPNFLVIGAQKAGTTSLHRYLSVHPNIYLPEQKETKFFVHDEIYGRGIEYYEEAFFGDASTEKAIGEIDPDYIYFTEALDRIFGDLDGGSLKYIVVLRNPIDRAISHYLMTFRRGVEDLSFEEAIEEESSRLRKRDRFNRMHFSYVDRGFYSRQLQFLLDHVGSSRVHVLLSDDLRRSPADVVESCCSFLGVEVLQRDSVFEQEYHQAAVPRSTALLKSIQSDGWHKQLVRKLVPIEKVRHGLRSKIIQLNEKSASTFDVDRETRLKLLNIYTDDIHELQRMTGLDLSKWLAVSNT